MYTGSKFQQNSFLNSKFGSAYIESSCCRKIIRPFTLPGKLLFTFKAIEFLTQNENLEKNLNNNEKNLKNEILLPKTANIFFPLITGILNENDNLF
jgi:hypothetical protein